MPQYKYIALNIKKCVDGYICNIATRVVLKENLRWTILLGNSVDNPIANNIDNDLHTHIWLCVKYNYTCNKINVITTFLCYNCIIYVAYWQLCNDCT